MPISLFKTSLMRKIDKEKLPKEALFTTKYGIKTHLYLNDHVMRQTYINGVYEGHIARHIVKLLRPNMIGFDCGANIGSYSLLFAKYLSSGKVHAFEPVPKTLAMLRENIELNGFKNIVVNPVAVADKPGELTIFFPSLTTASAYKYLESDDKMVVPVVSLDSYCEENKIDKIDVLKIDIEGGEVKCLEGAKNIIQRSDKLILIMEIDDNCISAGHTKTSLFNSVLAMGFKAYIPRAFPLPLQETTQISETAVSSLIFLKGY